MAEHSKANQALLAQLARRLAHVKRALDAGAPGVADLMKSAGGTRTPLDVMVQSMSFRDLDVPLSEMNLDGIAVVLINPESVEPHLRRRGGPWHLHGGEIQIYESHLVQPDEVAVIEKEAFEPHPDFDEADMQLLLEAMTEAQGDTDDGDPDGGADAHLPEDPDSLGA